ncbi:hypothetical protein [Sporisorium scitamineum]|uniref:Uncharacterized protein n=1 Tax=Sporisorium scitamineum TaxID=49012 RepID=A0A0F7S1W3_9BASI|nr:hypothetical protein [Sporisorium scitamineum]
MPRSDQVAVQANGFLDLRHGPRLERSAAPDAFKAASPFFDITPEVFRRFMSYESALSPKHATPSSPYRDASSALPCLASNQVLTRSPMDATHEAPGTIRRTIRGLPKKKPPADRSVASLAAKTAAWDHSQAKLPDPVVTSGAALSSTSQSDAHPRILRPSLTPSESLSNQASSGSLNSQPLAQYFEQLRVSAQEHRQDPVHTPVASISKQQQSAASPDSHSSFRFPSLPAILTDNSFHNRQRAAQFILLYSQWATREQLARCSRLSLAMDFSLPRLSKTDDSIKRVTAGQSADHQAAEGSSYFTLDNNEINHSHQHAHSASDDESEYLDFDACRTAHLGNKKKRKSTRHSSPTLPPSSNVEQGVHSDKTSVPSKVAPSPRDPARGSSQGTQNRALVDKTNTAHQPAPHLSVCPIYKHEDATAPPEPSTGRRHSYVRLPPRLTSSERQKLMIRKRLRARLAPIFQRRMLDRVQELDRFRQEHQEVQNTYDARVKAEADTALEKRIPAKRTSKAGKRAQAIRGGGSSAKPLTIAEIRARAAAATTGSSGASNVAVKMTSSPASPKDPARTPHRVSVEPPNSMPVSSTATECTPTDTPVPSRCKLPAPTSTFDFRMSSNVTFRLRELRSQLDAATRNLGVGRGDSRAFTGGSQPARISPSDSREVEAKGDVTKQSEGHPGRVLPWAHRTLDYQKRVTEQQRINAKSHQTHHLVKDEKPSPPALASQARDGTSTSKQQGKQSSPPARPKGTPASPSTSTTKATNGRRTALRRPVEPSHKHGAACKHDHAHGHGRSHGTGSALFTPDDWICLFCEYELYYGETPLMLRACRNRKKLVEKKSKAKSKAKQVLQKKASTKQHKGRRGSHRARPQPRARNGPEAYDAHREICDCGNSIHSSDFDDKDK